MFQPDSSSVHFCFYVHLQSTPPNALPISSTNIQYVAYGVKWNTPDSQYLLHLTSLFHSGQSDANEY
jgi:hypothetical protein